MSDQQQSQYIRHHNLPLVIDDLLKLCVPSRHPHPSEAIQQRLPFVRDFNNVKTSDAQSGTNSNKNPPSITHSDVRSIDFDVFTVAGDALNDEGIQIIERIFTDPRRNFLRTFNIPVSTFREWVCLVRQNYHSENPFHNFRHAVNVLQTLHSYISSVHDTIETDLVTTMDGASGCVEWTTGAPVGLFSDVELFGCYIAALCHDLQHPGVNNTYLIATGHPLANRYNDRSVLESHHAAVTFALLDPENNGGLCILEGIKSQGLYREFRGIVLECILGTDVTKHKESISTLHTNLTLELALPHSSTQTPPVNNAEESHHHHSSSTTNNHTHHEEELRLYQLIGHNRILARDARANTISAHHSMAGPTSEEASRISTLTSTAAATKRLMLLQALVEAADISNEARAHRFSQMWAPLVGEEFWQQGDKEKALGMQPVAQMFDRDKMNLPRDQQGFITYLCLPLYKELANLLPTTFCPRVASLETNVVEWAKTTAAVDL